MANPAGKKRAVRSATPEVGSRIRAIRERSRLSLRALAERCGLSVNAISLIERGENSPTVSSLHLLSRALGVPIVEFFQEVNDSSVVHTPRDLRVLYRRRGVVMEGLGLGLAGQQLQPFLIALEPGHGNNEAVTHPGQEFVHCLKGRIEYHVGSDTFRLGPGDSLLLDAARPHHFRNTSSAPARILVVFQTAMETEGELGRLRHMDA